MAKDMFEIRFDKHGHIVLEDPELKRRIRALLDHDQQIVFRLVGDQPVDGEPMPNVQACFFPKVGEAPPVRNGILCPNAVCFPRSALKVVNVARFEEMMERPEVRPEGY